MNDDRRNSFPLTTAQRGLWFSNKIAPDAIMSIAEAVEICGPIQPEIFQQALHQLVAEAEELRVGIVEENGRPRQIPRAVYNGEFPYLDMSHESDPQAAIHAWMMEELAQPIDLANDPLWISALLKADDRRYFWYQRAHHIVYDGYGGGLVARRLAELYTAYAQGQEPAPNSFCAVEASVEAEANYRNSDRFLRDREYWLEQLSDLPEAVTLSRSNHRHGLSGTLLRSVGHLSAETARRLTELGKTASASLPQVLISLVAAYYQRITGMSDLVFLMPVSGRINGVLRRSVSVSANMMPIRLCFMPEMTASELFVQVSRVVRNGLRRQQYRYEDLRRDMGLVGQRQNIAWLGINIEPFDYRLSFDGAETLSHNLSNSSVEDLMIFVYDRGTDAGLRFDLDANPALYKAGELDEHRRRLTRLIEQVLAYPNTPLQQLDIMGKEERHRLLVEWNDTQAPFTYTSLPALVAHWAKTTPDAPAVVFDDTVVSYRELHERCVRQAIQLLASGVRPGDVVAVALPRSEQLLVVLLAIMRTGAAYLPIDLDSPIDRQTLVLEDAVPSALIAERQLHARFLRGGCPLLQPEFSELPLSYSHEEFDFSKPESTAYVLYTSGSTGRPKGVEITHHNLRNFLQGMQLLLEPRATDRFLAVTTIIFDIAGLELYLPLTVGASVIMASSEAVYNPPLLARLIQNSGASHMQATPSLWRILLASPETKLDEVHVLVGGEALSAELAARLKSMAARVTQLYGPTETTVWSTACELESVGDAPPPIGRPILNTQLYVLDEEGQPVVTGAVGELYIGGAGVAKGYLNRPKLTAERFLENPFVTDGSRMYRTGDLVRWNEDGQLEFIGRADNQVKVNGHRIELGEIESLLLQHVTVAEAAVAAHRSSDGTTSLAAYVVPPAGMMAELNTLRTFLAGRLPGYMMPANFMVLDAMPLTPNGKLDRKALPVPERTTRIVYVEPVTQTEKKLAELWQRLLKVERVGLHDNFFELGGDSLIAAEMIAHFPAIFQMELPFGSLFESPTISTLAAIVDRLSSEQVDPLGVMLPLRKVNKASQRPLFCIHPIAGVSLGFSSLLRHLDASTPIYGLQSRGLRGNDRLPSSIEEIAADYLEQIRQIQPEGPYRLLGRSLGGMIGHSIAEQMQARNLKVEFLAMIDSSLFITGEPERPHSEEEDEVRAALGFLDIHLDGEKMPRSLRELGEYLLNPDNVNSLPAAQQGIMKVGKELVKSDPDFLKHLCAVMLNNLKVARAFVPRKVDLDLLYFHATEVTGKLDGIINRNPSAWRTFIGGKIEVHELNCHHEAVLDPAPASQIGKVLKQRLSILDDRRVVTISPLGHGDAGTITAAYA